MIGNISYYDFGEEGITEKVSEQAYETCCCSGSILRYSIKCLNSYQSDRAIDKESVLGDLKEKKQEIAKKDPAKDAATKAATKKHETSL